jgi:hypothetical protein
MTRKLPLQIRIDPRLEASLKRLARKNRRSVTSEVNNIIEYHLFYMTVNQKPE